MRNKNFKLAYKKYFKIDKEKKEYFICKRYYLGKNDGEIINEFITSDTYFKNLEENKKSEFFELPYKCADKGIQHLINSWEVCND